MAKRPRKYHADENLAAHKPDHRCVYAPSSIVSEFLCHSINHIDRLQSLWPTLGTGAEPRKFIVALR